MPFVLFLVIALAGLIWQAISWFLDLLHSIVRLNNTIADWMIHHSTILAIIYFVIALIISIAVNNSAGRKGGKRIFAIIVNVISFVPYAAVQAFYLLPLGVHMKSILTMFIPLLVTILMLFFMLIVISCSIDYDNIFGISVPTLLFCLLTAVCLYFPLNGDGNFSWQAIQALYAT